MRTSRGAEIRLAELVAALSIATDLGMGQPMEYILRSRVLAVRLGKLLGFSASELREIYYLALLRYLGCNAETHEEAALVGDEIAFRTAVLPVDLAQPAQAMDTMVNFLRTTYVSLPAPDFDRFIAQLFLTWPQHVQESSAGHCEVGQRLASRLGFAESTRRAIGWAYARWDGQGFPAGGPKGAEIPLSVRVVALAQDAALFHRMGGVEMAVAVAKERAGGRTSPASSSDSVSTRHNYWQGWTMARPGMR